MSQANQLLGASYQQYYHAVTNDLILRTVGYALPAVLHTHVHTVVPTTAFTSSRPLQQTLSSRQARSATAQAGNTKGNTTSGESLDMNILPRSEPYITPSVLSSIYRTDTYRPVAQQRNALGVVGFESQVPSHIDFRSLLGNFAQTQLTCPSRSSRSTTARAGEGQTCNQASALSTPWP